MVKTSVIAAFYNNIKYLKLVLAGFQRQTEADFELIIADDGSTEAVVREIESITSNYSFRIRHIWHPDKGWCGLINSWSCVPLFIPEHRKYVICACI